MKLHCITQIINKNSEIPRRSVFKEGGVKVTELDTMGRVTDYYGKRPDEHEEPDFLSGKQALRTKVETKKELKEMPRPKTKEAEEKLKVRLIKEIFGDEETQKWYVDRVREALETMNSDRLHAFIVNHPRYGKGEFRKWNADLAKLLAISVEKKYKGKNEAHTNMRLTAATQIVLVEYYKNDVFQITIPEKKINPFIFIDAKWGPYSNSVLAEYWKHKHGPKSAKPDPNRSGLKKSYGAKSKQVYGDAMAYLDAQLSTVKPPAPEEKKPKGEKVDPADQLAANVKAQDYYEKLDKAGDSMTFDRLAITDGYRFDLDMPNLSRALATVFEEDPKKPAESPKLFRTLHLIAERIGAEVDTWTAKSGDTLYITKEGQFRIQKADGSIRHEINLANS